MSDELLDKHEYKSLSDLNLNISDMVIRYGVSEDEIMQYFMHAGLPYHKKDSTYEFVLGEVRNWEYNTKCITWEPDRFDIKYYDLIKKKFINRSDYVDILGLESVRHNVYLESKRRAHEVEEQKALEAFEKRRHMNIFRMVCALIIFISAIMYYTNPIDSVIFNRHFYFLVMMSSLVCLLFTFQAFRAIFCFGLVFAILAGFLYLSFKNQEVQNVINTINSVPSGGAQTINELGSVILRLM